MEEVT